MGILKVFSTWEYSVLEVLIFKKVSGRSYFKNSGKNRFLELCSCCSRDVLCPCLCTTKELQQGLVFLICLLGKNTDLQSFLLHEQNTADRLRRHFLANHERELKDALISSVSQRCYQSLMDKKKNENRKYFAFWSREEEEKTSEIHSSPFLTLGSVTFYIYLSSNLPGPRLRWQLRKKFISNVIILLVGVLGVCHVFSLSCHASSFPAKISPNLIQNICCKPKYNLPLCYDLASGWKPNWDLILRNTNYFNEH